MSARVVLMRWCAEFEVRVTQMLAFVKVLELDSDVLPVRSSYLCPPRSPFFSFFSFFFLTSLLLSPQLCLLLSRLIVWTPQDLSAIRSIQV